MKVELPKLKRCCFCLPLRYGLITSAYLRLVLLLVMFSYVTYLLATTATELTESVIVIKSLFLLLLVADTCLTVVFLVGGHRKTTKLLKVFYIYNIVLLCLFTLFFSWALGYDLLNVENLSRSFGYAHYIGVIQMNILMGILFLGIQAYFILLLRSEIAKLNNFSNCRFDNLTVEAQCILGNGTFDNGINFPYMDQLKGCNENGTDSKSDEICYKNKEVEVNPILY